MFINYETASHAFAIVSGIVPTHLGVKDEESLKDQKAKPYPRRTNLLAVKGGCQLPVASLPARYARYASPRLRRFAPDVVVDPCTCDGC